MKVLALIAVGLVPWLVLLAAAYIERAIGTAGLMTLGGEGEGMDTGTQPENSGDSAPPSPPRLFMVGRKLPYRPMHVVTWYGAEYVSTDSGVPEALAPYIGRET